MNRLMHSVGVTLVHWRLGAQYEVQYRMNFFLQVIQSAVRLVTGIVAIQLVFGFTNQLGGWSEPELYAVLGVHVLLGGVLATLRMTLPSDGRDVVSHKLAVEVLPNLARGAMITGVHLCMTDVAASAGRTEETKGRDDIQVPPDTVLLIEGCQLDAVEAAALACVQAADLTGARAPAIGLYRHEYTRLKTAWAAG